MFDFSGKYKATVDDKGRVVVPSMLKKEMGELQGGLFSVEKDPYEKCLNIYPIGVWQNKIERIKAALNYNDRLQSKLLDKLYQKFVKVGMSEKGRLNIPAHLLDEADIAKAIIFTGQGDRIRMWDVKAYDESLLSDDDYADLFEKYLGGSPELE